MAGLLPLPVVGPTQAIFDTGTTQIVGDPQGIKQFYAPLYVYGARLDTDLGEGIYTSTSASIIADQKPHNIFLYHSPMQLQHSHLLLCWREGSQDCPCHI